MRTVPKAAVAKSLPSLLNDMAVRPPEYGSGSVAKDFPSWSNRQRFTVLLPAVARNLPSALNETLEIYPWRPINGVPPVAESNFSRASAAYRTHVTWWMQALTWSRLLKFNASTAKSRPRVGEILNSVSACEIRRTIVALSAVL